MEPTNTLCIQLPKPALERFNTLFGEGVGFETHTGIALTSFLCDQIGIAPDYLDQRVQTIFVNARAVDRVEQIHIGPGDVIALSAAMPGLAGATLRKGGLLAGFRKDISHVDDPHATGAAQKTMVTVKLFNLVAREIGAQLLQHGVWVKGKRLEPLFEQTKNSFLWDARALLWNDRSISVERLREQVHTAGLIHLRLQILTD
jgi:hypothetical protein